MDSDSAVDLDRGTDGVWYRFIRPVMDRFVAVFIFIVLSPFLIVIAVTIRVSSAGPAVFRQSRVGRSQQAFTMYKFRTMEHGVSDERHREFVRALLTANQDKVAASAAPDGVFKLANDERTTGVGRLLRRTGLDELPQLLNVMKGDMALVGPRPAIDYEVEHYRHGDHVRFEVLPGITGLWQAGARNTVDMQTMLDMDSEYVSSRGPLLDVRILARTVAGIVRLARSAR